MRQHVEPLTGGLVTARDISLLNVGELSRCDNATYTPWTQSLRRALGRVGVGGTFGTQKNGMAVARFDNGSSWLFIQDNNQLWRSTVGSGGALAPGVVESFLDSGLNSATYDNWVFLFNGTAENRVVRNDGTLRAHGIQPVASSPGYTTTTVANGWDSTFPGYFEFWTTEVIEYTENGTVTELESSFSGVPASVFVGTADVRITISRPSTINAAATKWRVYRSTMKTTNALTEFPVGQRIAELPISATQFIVGVPSITSYIFAATPDGTGWTNPGNVSSDNGVYATTTITSGNPFFPPPVTSQQIYKDFNFTGIIEPVVGIEIELQAKADSPGHSQIAATVSGAGAPPVPPSLLGGTKTGTLNTTDTVSILGGPNDLWGQGYWSIDSFTNANFRLYLIAQTQSPFSVTFSVDYVKVRVYHSGGVTTGTFPFPFITVDVEGITASVPSNSPPPKFISADVFQDSLVGTDGNNLYYSLAGQPEYFPTLYFLPVPSIYPTKLVKRVGDRLLIGTTNSIFRCNYLPTELDASFNRGIVLHEISPEFGPVNQHAACTFTGVNGPELAFVSRQGLMATNGYSIRTLSQDLDWSFLVNEANLSLVRLINNPERWELVLYYPNGANSDKKLHFNYHPGHLKNGMLKVSGPVDTLESALPPRSVATYEHADGTTKVYTGYTTFVTVDAGILEAYLPTVTTRQMYLNGFSYEGTIQEIYTHHTVISSIGTIFVTPLTQKTNAAEQTRTGKPFTPNFIGSSRTVFNLSCEGLRVQLQETGIGDIGLDFITILIPTAPNKEDSARTTP